MNLIPVLRPSYDYHESLAINEVLKSGWSGLGPKTKLFEEEFSKYINTSYAVGLNSCTSALWLALSVLNLQPGDEIISTPLTFVSTIHAICYNNLTPIFADVDPITLCIDPQDIVRKITKRTRAIIAVHYAGHSCKLDMLQKICKEYSLILIEDCAHACGAEFNGQKIGSISDLNCFSFHAVKNLSMADGGAITTSNPEYDKYFREMRWLSISRDTFARTNENEIYAWRYDVTRLGYKMHMNDLNASIGLVQLTKLDAANQKRREIAQRYTEAFKTLNWIETPVELSYAKSSWHLYVIKTPEESIRDRLIKHLKDRNIAPGVHYYPINLHSYYRNQNANIDTPVSNKIWKRIISLPMFPDLTLEDQERVINAILEFKP